tara:strand:+ start:1363 stop:1647 length:285 start_codon:yes stop_codon:yes gene_type:complete
MISKNKIKNFDMNRKDKKLENIKLKNLLKYKKNFILYGLFLLIIFVLLEPQRKLFNAKDICGKWWMGQIDKKIAYKKLYLIEEGDLLEYCVHFR